MIENLRISDRIYHTLKVQIFVPVPPSERTEWEIMISDEASGLDKPDCGGAAGEQHKLEHKEHHDPVAAVADSVIDKETEKCSARRGHDRNKRRCELHEDNGYQVAYQRGEQNKLKSVHHSARPCTVGLGIHCNGIHSNRGVLVLLH